MRTQYVVGVLIISALIVACGQEGKMSSGTAPQDKNAETRRIAKDAFIFTYPLIMNYRTTYLQAVDSGAKEYVGGFGKYKHYGMSSPENHDIVTPNNDTPYSWAQVDLRTEPWVLTQAATDGRYFTAQWDDMWGFVLDNPGAVKDGNSGGSYLLVPPNWNGTLPLGIKRAIKGETYFLGTLTRTGVKGVSDLPNMQKTQRGYKLEPLSAYLKKPAPPAAPNLDWPAWVPDADKGMDCFKYANFMLTYTQPNAADKPTLDEIAKIGIAGGKPWDASKLDPDTSKAIQDGIADAWALMKETEKSVKDAGKFFGPREMVGTDYLNRTMGVYMGIYGNVKEQAIYQTWPTDSDGQPLDASSNKYSVTFEPGKLPQAKYFWSITMYDLPGRFLVANPIKRYSIGSQTPGIKKSADGSLTIYVQRDTPGKAKEPNWLPAPNSPFFAVLRVYGPDQTEQNGTWVAPPVKKAD
jgi:hypothetical protein